MFGKCYLLLSILYWWFVKDHFLLFFSSLFICFYARLELLKDSFSSIIKSIEPLSACMEVSPLKSDDKWCNHKHRFIPLYLLCLDVFLRWVCNLRIIKWDVQGERKEKTQRERGKGNDFQRLLFIFYDSEKRKKSLILSVYAGIDFRPAIPVSNEYRVDSFFSNSDQIALMLVSTDCSVFPFVFLFLSLALAFVHIVVLLIDKIRKLIEKQTFPSGLARSTAYEGQMLVIVMFIYDWSVTSSDE